MDYQSEINRLNSEIDTLQAEYNRLMGLVRSWRDSANFECDQRLKRKREDCEEDRANRLRKASDRETAAKGVKAKIASLQSQIDTYEDLLKAQGETEMFLAKSGTTAEAEAIKATAEAENKKDNNALFIAIAAAVAILIGIFIYKKFF